jgi:hypothetical protein
MDETMNKHYDYAAWNAAADRQQDKYNGMDPYDYYRSEGFSPEKAQSMADADRGYFGQSNFSSSK